MVAAGMVVAGLVVLAIGAGGAVAMESMISTALSQIFRVAVYCRPHSAGTDS